MKAWRQFTKSSLKKTNKVPLLRTMAGETYCMVHNSKFKEELGTYSRFP
jgi:hypothetical protein